jgi:hypothetical protein
VQAQCSAGTASALRPAVCVAGQPSIMAAFCISLALNSDAERQVPPDQPLRLLYEALADAAPEGMRLTDSIEPDGYDGFIELQGAPGRQGPIEQLLARVCLGTDLSASWFEVLGSGDGAAGPYDPAPPPG